MDFQIAFESGDWATEIRHCQHISTSHATPRLRLLHTRQSFRQPATTSPISSAVVADMPLSGKVAVVTGSSGGIGAAIAQTLASAGAQVVLGARRVDELEKVKAKIEAEVGNNRVIVCKVDVTKRSEVKALVAAAEAGFGPVDIMVNNAGEKIGGGAVQQSAYPPSAAT